MLVETLNSHGRACAEGGLTHQIALIGSAKEYYQATCAELVQAHETVTGRISPYLKSGGTAAEIAQLDVDDGMSGGGAQDGGEAHWRRKKDLLREGTTRSTEACVLCCLKGREKRTEQRG